MRASEPATEPEKFSISIRGQGKTGQDRHPSIINKITHQTRRQPHKNANIKRFYASLFTCQKKEAATAAAVELTRKNIHTEMRTKKLNRYTGRLSCHSLVAGKGTGKKGGVCGSNPAIFSYTSCRRGGPASV